MLCLSGFELYSGWVPLVHPDDQTQPIYDMTPWIKLLTDSNFCW